MSELSEKTVAAITERHVEPVPVWLVQLQNGAYWCGTVFLVLLAVVVAAIASHALFEVDWFAYQHAHVPWWHVILSDTPFVFFILLMMLLFVGVVLLHQTRYGYRYSLSLVIGLFLIISVASGFLIERSPLDQRTERLMVSLFPHRERLPGGVLPSADRQWSQPDQGLLGGIILSVDKEQLRLLDLGREEWQVQYQGARVDTRAYLVPEEEIKMIGTVSGDHAFQAVEIMPWERSPFDHERRNEERREEKAEKALQESNQMYENRRASGEEE